MKFITITIITFSLLQIGCNSANQQSNSDSPSVPKTEINKTISASPAIEVGKGPDALFITPDHNFLYVANVEDTFISVIDTRKDKVIKNITGVKYPWGFTRLGQSNLVAVSGWDKKIAVIDFSKHEVVIEKTFDSNLAGITSSSDGKFIYVIAATDKKVLKLNEKLELLDDFDTGNGPDGIGISKDDAKLYVANTEDGTISIINVADMITSLITTGGKPEQVHHSHDHTLLYISNFFKNEVYVINTETDSIIHKITGLDGPEEAVADEKNEKLYVVNFNSAKVFVYEIPGYTKLDAEYPTGSKPIGVIPANGKLYVSDYGDNAVSFITE